MKALIIEDEAQAISALKAELKSHCPLIDVIGEAKSIKEGVNQIKSLQPELVFLDI